jgi:alkaline phosphatase D
MKFVINGLTLLILIITGCKSLKEEQNIVIMFSMDGFRWDYADKVPTPNLDRIAKMGVRAESLKASFPTKTFPNHYSIATGLYPDNHGIVLNSFVDPATGKYYKISDREAVEDGFFYEGEPIWITAEKQGVVSGSFFWVGSEAEIGGIRPTYWKKYDYKFPYKQRVDTVISWLQKPEDIRPRLILWYVSEPDHSGHKFGPDSKELLERIMELDTLVGYFLDEIDKLPIAENINIIITSDHGMGSTSEERKIVLEESLTMDWIAEMEGYNPNYNIKARDGYYDSVYNELTGIEHITAWKSEMVPERLHYGTHDRTLDFVIVADSSWSLVKTSDKKTGFGAHGYDNDNKDMHAIFYAYGPAFKENYISPTFNNIDIYPLIAHILKLERAEVDGKFENVKQLLKE